MPDMHAIEQLAAWLRREDGFTLISHISPDGDTLGSSMALFGMLRQLGKAVQIVCDQPVPKTYRFLPFAAEVQLTEEVSAGYSNVVAVDCADSLRMGNAQPLFYAARETGDIDHHVTNTGYACFNVLDDHAAATGELMYRIGLALGIEFTPEIATCLYVALNTDTGNFAYSNTTPNTLRIAAELLEKGIHLADINRKLYRTVPVVKTRLLGCTLNKLELYCDDRISLSTITQEDLTACGAKSEDVEGIIDHIRDVETAEIGILIRESSIPNTYKVSMRSKEYADVAKIAANNGGGGHIHAAGCTMKDMSMDEAKNILLNAAREALNQRG